MDPLREIGRALLILGGILAVIGCLFYFSGRVPGRFGRLPGDIVYHGRHGTFYFPIITCILLSVGISLVLWIIGQLRR